MGAKARRPRRPTAAERRLMDVIDRRDAELALARGRIEGLEPAAAIGRAAIEGLRARSGLLGTLTGIEMSAPLHHQNLTIHYQRTGEIQVAVRGAPPSQMQPGDRVVVLLVPDEPERPIPLAGS